MTTDVPLPYDFDCSIEGYTQCISHARNIRYLCSVCVKPFLMFTGEGKYNDLARIALNGGCYNFISKHSEFLGNINDLKFLKK